MGLATHWGFRKARWNEDRKMGGREERKGVSEFQRWTREDRRQWWGRVWELMRTSSTGAGFPLFLGEDAGFSLYPGPGAGFSLCSGAGIFFPDFSLQFNSYYTKHYNSDSVKLWLFTSTLNVSLLFHFMAIHHLRNLKYWYIINN